MNLPTEVSEELLMAYADGELEGAEHAAERARVAAAMQADPDVARRVETFRALRRRLNSELDRVLDEQVPDRLIAAVRGGPTKASSTGASSAPTASKSSNVADFGAARAAKTGTSERLASTRSAWTWSQWGAMAASLVIGAVIGHLALKSPELSPIVARDGHLVAQAGLAEALSNQLASAQPENSPVRIGTSFKAKSGAFCRTFVLAEGDGVAGLACRAGDEWNVHTLARTTAIPGADGGYRQAGSAMPAPVLAAVESEISGDPLDSSGEARAKDVGWK